MAGELQDAFEKLSNQARFVQMIVDKKLVVSNRKKVDIVADLRHHEFRPYPKKPKGPKVSDDDDNQDNAAEEVDDELDTDFDYLLTMPIYNLTKEKVLQDTLYVVRILMPFNLQIENSANKLQTRRRSFLLCWRSRPSKCGMTISTTSWLCMRSVLPLFTGTKMTTICRNINVKSSKPR